MFQKMLDRQYRQPSGLIGRWIGQRMASQHIPENLWTVELLKPQKYDHILEIGFGPGVAIQALTQHVTEGWIAGIDFSQTMVRTAQKR
ncbi:MAG TPA: hypothetical protein VJZ27_06940, partial [Aggregatilineales bacterium]|nr:hypothetical protein [Aggregatilineales bacterium]